MTPTRLIIAIASDNSSYPNNTESTQSRIESDLSNIHPEPVVVKENVIEIFGIGSPIFCEEIELQTIANALLNSQNHAIEHKSDLNADERFGNGLSEVPPGLAAPSPANNQRKSCYSSDLSTSVALNDRSYRSLKQFQEVQINAKACDRPLETTSPTFRASNSIIWVNKDLSAKYRKIDLIDNL